MTPRPHRQPLRTQRHCFQCNRVFTATRSDARYCSAKCRQRAARAPVRLVDCYDPEQRQEGEPDSVYRFNAAAWQLSEAERLAKEFALLQPGTEPYEISNKTLRGVRAIARAWAKLWKELRARRLGPAADVFGTHGS
jgi:hypothetical protein